MCLLCEIGGREGGLNGGIGNRVRGVGWGGVRKEGMGREGPVAKY